MSQEIIVAIIAGSMTVCAAIITAVFKLIEARISKRINVVQESKSNNDYNEMKNDILSIVVPIFERKDETFDRVGEIMEGYERRISLIEQDNREMLSLIRRINDFCESQRRKGDE